eukprot:313536_1
MYGKTEKSINYYCIWIDYIFSICYASFSKINQLNLRFMTYFGDKIKLLNMQRLNNLCKFITNHKTLKSLTIEDETGSIDLIEFWYAILNSIKSNKTIQSLSISPGYPDIAQYIHDLKQSDTSYEKIELLTAQKTSNYHLILDKIGSTIYFAQNLNKIAIEFQQQNETPFRSLDVSKLLYGIINNHNINEIIFNSVNCRNLTQLQKQSV